ncbi:uncharacterized protein LOC130048805 [Ostrea edulis]|uniref:uncharacterized protein LOC130048805 n=1 Tax=Ostrea edulis TaxID=37623 RepID=UPI0024AF66F9|nr:uncharacterized protein LOC130048805 [Ostrea edulis]
MEFSVSYRSLHFAFCIGIILGLLFNVQTTLIEELSFLQDRRFDNYVLDHGLLWDFQSMSKLACSAGCASFKTCISFHFNKENRRCRAYETLMFTTEAGVYENNWSYFYLTEVGKCPPLYAYSRQFEYCVGYEGHFNDGDGLAKCQENNGRYLLVRTAEESRFASLLGYNFDKLPNSRNRQLRIQGTFDFTDMTWKDDNGNTLTFTQFVTEEYTPIGDHALYITTGHVIPGGINTAENDDLESLIL